MGTNQTALTEPITEQSDQVGETRIATTAAATEVEIARIALDYDEICSMNDEQLAFSLREAQQELFRLRFQAATEKLDAPSNLMKLRREIARIKTIQRERELAATVTT